MNIRKYLFAGLLAASVTAGAQGKWDGESETFTYAFEPVRKDKFAGTGMQMASISTAGSTTDYLPAPAAGTAKLLIDAYTGGSFSLIGKTGSGKLKIVASSSLPNQNAPASVSKFSMYDLPLSNVVSIFFTIDINAFANNGQVMIPFGYTKPGTPDNGNTFNDSQQFSEWWDAQDIFGAIKLDVFDRAWLWTGYRQPRKGPADLDAPKFVELPSNTSFNKGRSHKVEIYCNNSKYNQTYTRNGKTFTVFPQTYQLWVNGEHLKVDKNTYDFPSTREIPADTPINSFAITTAGNTYPTPNSLELAIGNLNIGYITKK